MRRTVVIGLLAGWVLAGCGDTASNQTATPPNTPPPPPGPAPFKADPLKAFEETAFCIQFGCQRGESWPLRGGGTNNTYSLSAAPDVTVEVPTKGGAIDHYGLSFYERERLRNGDLNVIYGLLRTLDPAGGSGVTRQFIRANVERPIEQIKLGRSTRVGKYTVWAGRIGGTQTVSIDPTSGATR